MMDTSPLKERITRNPGILGGKPTIRGTHVGVQLINDWNDSGVSTEDMLADYPVLSREDIEAAIAYRSFEASKVEIRSWRAVG